MASATSLCTIPWVQPGSNASTLVAVTLEQNILASFPHLRPGNLLDARHNIGGSWNHAAGSSVKVDWSSTVHRHFHVFHHLPEAHLHRQESLAVRATSAMSSYGNGETVMGRISPTLSPAARALSMTDRHTLAVVP